MTTFTMQDINPIPTTKEEEEAMDTAIMQQELNKITGENSLQQTIQGVTGAQYTLMDTSPESQEVVNIINTICTQLQALSSVINNLRKQAQSQPTQSLQDTVELVLTQSKWFKELFTEEFENQVGDMNSTIEGRVDAFFSHAFDIRDYADVDGIVSDKVDDELSDIVEDKLSDIVEEKLEVMVAEKLSRMTISFN